MTEEREPARTELIEQLRSDGFVESHHIEDDTDLLYDLGLAGADLCDFLDWVSLRFKTDLSSMTPRDYNLNEPPSSSFTLFRKRKYKSLTIGQLLQAIQSGRWIVQ